MARTARILAEIDVLDAVASVVTVSEGTLPVASAHLEVTAGGAAYLVLRIPAICADVELRNAGIAAECRFCLHVHRSRTGCNAPHPNRSSARCACGTAPGMRCSDTYIETPEPERTVAAPDPED